MTTLVVTNLNTGETFSEHVADRTVDDRLAWYADRSAKAIERGGKGWSVKVPQVNR